MLRKIVFGGLMLVTASAAMAQAPRPAVGGIGSPPDAMIFYVAHGAPNACGPGCSDWIAAEGTVQWDTHKRLFNILDRNAGRRLPLIIHAWGESNLNVATSARPHPARARHRHHGGRDRGRGVQRQAGGGVLCAETSGRTARRQDQVAGGALRTHLRADAGGRRASHPARRHPRRLDRHVPAQPHGAECLAGSARHPARTLRRTVPQISARHGRRDRTARHRRPPKASRVVASKCRRRSGRGCTSSRRRADGSRQSNPIA